MYDDIRNIVPIISDKDVPMYPYVNNVKSFIQNVEVEAYACKQLN